jgi:hypothetical protein
MTEPAGRARTTRYRKQGRNRVTNLEHPSRPAPSIWKAIFRVLFVLAAMGVFAHLAAGKRAFVPDKALSCDSPVVLSGLSDLMDEHTKGRQHVVDSKNYVQTRYDEEADHRYCKGDFLLSNGSFIINYEIFPKADKSDYIVLYRIVESGGDFP